MYVQGSLKYISLSVHGDHFPNHPSFRVFLLFVYTVYRSSWGRLVTAVHDNATKGRWALSRAITLPITTRLVHTNLSLSNAFKTNFKILPLGRASTKISAYRASLTILFPAVTHTQCSIIILTISLSYLGRYCLNLGINLFKNNIDHLFYYTHCITNDATLHCNAAHLLVLI